MVAIFVAPDRQYHKVWESFAFRTDWNAPDEVVRKTAMDLLRQQLEPAITRWGWDVDWSVPAQIRPHPFPGLPEEVIARQEAGLMPLTATDRIIRDGVKDWIVMILVRQPMRVVPKFMRPLSLDGVAEAREDAPPDLQEGVGSETPRQYVNGN